MIGAFTVITQWALWLLLVLEGVQCDSKTESTGSRWLTVFSLTHKFKGPCVSDSLWKISLTETLSVSSVQWVSKYWLLKTVRAAELTLRVWEIFYACCTTARTTRLVASTSSSTLRVSSPKLFLLVIEDIKYLMAVARMDQLKTSFLIVEGRKSVHLRICSRWTHTTTLYHVLIRVLQALSIPYCQSTCMSVCLYVCMYVQYYIRIFEAKYLGSK